MPASTISYPDKMRLRVPQGLPEAVRVAARRNHTSPSEWARRALLRGLEAEGVRLVNPAAGGEVTNNRASHD
jgi:hypothetical protein